MVSFTAKFSAPWTPPEPIAARPATRWSGWYAKKVGDLRDIVGINWDIMGYYIYISLYIYIFIYLFIYIIIYTYILQSTIWYLGVSLKYAWPLYGRSNILDAKILDERWPHAMPGLIYVSHPQGLLFGFSGWKFGKGRLVTPVTPFECAGRSTQGMGCEKPSTRLSDCLKRAAALKRPSKMLLVIGNSLYNALYVWHQGRGSHDKPSCGDGTTPKLLGFPWHHYIHLREGLISWIWT